MLLTGLAMAVIAVAGVVTVFRYVDNERERDMRGWQSRLGVVAESRVAAVNDWADGQFQDLIGLSQNASFQIYVGELARGREDGRIEDMPELDYLRNLLVVTAKSGGFLDTSPRNEVNANLRQLGVAGIAVVDGLGHPLVTTEGMPPLEGTLRQFVSSLPRGERALLDLHLDIGGEPAMGFAVPIFAVQGDDTSATQIGAVVAVKRVGKELYRLLRQPGVTEQTSEAVLMRQSDQVVEYLSPLADGTAPLKRQLAINTSDLAGAFALEMPGGFAIKRDYRDTEVLVTSRKLAALPWVLMYKVDRSEALGASDARLNRLLGILLLAIAVCGAAIVAVWRHGASRRAEDAANRYRRTARELDEQRRFLRLVTDSQPNTIFIADEEGRYRFANTKAAERATIASDDMLGKTLASVVGPISAKRYEHLNRQALDRQEALTDVHRTDGEEKVRVLQSSHIPLDATSSLPRSVLVVEEDVTPAVVERERRERLLDQLVKCLVDAVDRRDSFAAHHSAKVATVARAVAEEMGLEPTLVETAETAGSLMNLGKILVPEDLLTRSGGLSDAERRKVRDSIQSTADFLEGIEFDGPVVETLRQFQEHWDGSGTPEGIEGEDIVVTARIIAVANTFVALISPRAHRDGKDFDSATEALMSGVGAQFDRRVVAALINRLDNKGGRDAWNDFVAPAPAA